MNADMTPVEGRVVLLDPQLLEKLKRQADQAEACLVCGSDPVLVMRHQFVEVYVSHTPQCRELSKRALRVVPGGVE